MKSLICISLVLLLGTSIVNAGGSVEPEPSPANETAPATEPATTEPAATEPATTEPAQQATAGAKASSTKLLKVNKSKLDVAAEASSSDNATTTDIQCQVPLCPSTASLATVEKHNCTAYQQLKDACSEELPCHPSFFCSNSTCVKKTSKGNSCSSLDECERGTVCDHGECINLFSVAAGQAADSNLACASGIVIGGVCQNAELTSGAVPKKCANDGDCTADDGITAGVCVCAEADNGQAYCKAHKSDKISLEHLRSAHEDISEDVELSTFEYTNYPTLDVASACYKNSSELFANLAVLEQQAADCFGYFLKAAALVVVMVLA